MKQHIVSSRCAAAQQTSQSAYRNPATRWKYALNSRDAVTTAAGLSVLTASMRVLKDAIVHGTLSRSRMRGFVVKPAAGSACSTCSTCSTQRNCSLPGGQGLEDIRCGVSLPKQMCLSHCDCGHQHDQIRCNDSFGLTQVTNIAVLTEPSQQCEAIVKQARTGQGRPMHACSPDLSIAAMQALFSFNKTTNTLGCDAFCSFPICNHVRRCRLSAASPSAPCTMFGYWLCQLLREHCCLYCVHA